MTQPPQKNSCAKSTHPKRKGEVKNMPTGRKKAMLIWFLFEVVTLAIGTVHLILVPENRPYAIPAYIAVWIGAAAWVVVWTVHKKKHKDNW
jgi:hypothetical protein